MARVFDDQLLLTARAELGLTQEQAASAIGVDVRTYRRYESGAVNDPDSGFSIRHASRKRTVAAMCREFGIEPDQLVREREPSPASPVANASWKPCVVHPLQRAAHFVGRAELLDWLSSWSRAEHPPGIVALVGVGGAGKTSIAERLSSRILERTDPSAGVLIWSFYEDPRVDAFLRAAVAYFSTEALASERGELVNALREALCSGPAHTLILDGLEVAQHANRAGRVRGELEDPTLRRLLRGVAARPGGARVLVTSRYPLIDLRAWEGEGLVSIELGDFSPAEARELLDRWGARGTAAEIDRVLEPLGYHPLSVAMLASFVSHCLGGECGRYAGASLELVSDDEPLARRLGAVLDSYAEALTPSERDLLARLAVFSHGVELELVLGLADTPELAGALAGLSEQQLRADLARLERLGLVAASQRGFLAHPFVRRFFRTRLDVPAAEIHGLERKRLRQSLVERPDQLTRDTQLLDLCEDLLYHTLRTGEPREALRIYSHRMGGFGYLGLHAGDMIRGERVLRAFSRDRDPGRIDARLSSSERAAIAYDWGLYNGGLGELRLARRCYEAHNDIVAAAHSARLGPSSGLALGYRTLAYTLRLLGELPEALASIQRSIEIAEQTGAHFHLIRSLGLAASILHDLGRTGQSAELFERMESLEGARPQARRGLWLAEHLLELGSREAAATLTRQNLEHCAALGWTGHVGHCELVLGRCVVEADPDAAAGHLERARHWCELSGEVEMQLRAHELAAHVALVEGRTLTVARETGEGLLLAEADGFGLFAVRLLVLAAEGARSAGQPERAVELASRARRWAEDPACDYRWGVYGATLVECRAAAELGERDVARARLDQARRLHATLGLVDERRLDHIAAELDP